MTGADRQPVVIAGFDSAGSLEDASSAEDAAHIARFDPARVLAECEAKKRIFEEHSGTTAYLTPEDQTGETCLRCEDIWPCIELRAIAAVYADHPGYRPEWKP